MNTRLSDDLAKQKAYEIYEALNMNLILPYYNIDGSLNFTFRKSISYKCRITPLEDKEYLMRVYRDVRSEPYQTYTIAEVQVKVVELRLTFNKIFTGLNDEENLNKWHELFYA